MLNRDYAMRCESFRGAIRRHRFATFSWGLISLCGSIAIEPIQAQITPDNTLGRENSVVTPNITINEAQADLIEGGAIRDNNLFHSFSELNVGDGNAVYFASPDGIANILTRVTGNNISNIFGTLGVDGAANLFLLNPNGIIFGENSALDINGSFLATTGESYIFDNGFAYDARNTDAPPLLTINLPLGIQFGDNSGDITVQGTGHNISSNPLNVPIIRDLRNTGLEVPHSSTLALLGENLNLVGGNLTSAGGRIELGSIAETGMVSIISTDNGFSLGYENISSFNDINFTQAASVDVSGSGNGDLHIQGRNLSLADGSTVFANTTGTDNGKNVKITTSDSIEIIGTGVNDFRSSYGTFTTAIFSEVESTATGNGGNLIIDTSDLSLGDNARISSSNFGIGDSGNQTITADTIKVTSNSQIGAGVYGEGNGGDISIAALEIEIIGELATEIPTGFFTNVLSFNPQSIFPATIGTGNSGDINVQTEQLRISNQGWISSTVLGKGKGGDINIVTDVLQINNNGQIKSGTSDAGDSGNLSIVAKDIEIVGVSNTRFFTGLFTNVVTLPPNNIFFQGKIATGDGGDINVQTEKLRVDNQGAINSSVLGAGNGGDVNIATNILQITNGGQIDSKTFFANGNAGNITVQAAETVEIAGYDLVLDRDRNQASFAFSGLFANVVGGTGNGGNLILSTPSLRLDEGSSIVTSTAGIGNAGNISIVADDVEVKNRIVDSFDIASGITSAVEFAGTGNGGNVKLNVGNLRLLDGGAISVDAIGQGNAGNITIDAHNLNIGGLASGETIAGIEQLASPAAISAFSQGDFDAGNININSDSLQLEDRGNISVSNLGNGNSGNLNIITSKLSLDNSATIEAKVDAGNKGNIDLKTDNIFLNNQSEITVLAAGLATGGNISINNTDNIVLLENSRIIADAVVGNGGKIDITAQGLFVSADSLISASSEFGLDGNVEVENINDDRPIELAKLSSNLINATEQITTGCNSNSDFAIAGRGGLPDNPTQNLRGQATWQDLRIPQIQQASVPLPKFKATPQKLVIEAETWRVNPAGKIELIAVSPQNSNSALNHDYQCQSNQSLK